MEDLADAGVLARQFYPTFHTTDGAVCIKDVRLDESWCGSVYMWEVRGIQAFLTGEDASSYHRSAAWICDHLAAWRHQLDAESIRLIQGHIVSSLSAKERVLARLELLARGQPPLLREAAFSSLALVAILGRLVAVPRKGKEALSRRGGQLLQALFAKFVEPLDLTTIMDFTEESRDLDWREGITSSGSQVSLDSGAFYAAELEHEAAKSPSPLRALIKAAINSLGERPRLVDLLICFYARSKAGVRFSWPIARSLCPCDRSYDA